MKAADRQKHSFADFWKAGPKSISPALRCLIGNSWKLHSYPLVPNWLQHLFRGNKPSLGSWISCQILPLITADTQQLRPSLSLSSRALTDWRMLPEILDHLFLPFFQEIHESPKRHGKQNSHWKKIYISASCWFYGTWKMAYLLPIQAINPIFS